LVGQDLQGLGAALFRHAKELLCKVVWFGACCEIHMHSWRCRRITFNWMRAFASSASDKVCNLRVREQVDSRSSTLSNPMSQALEILAAFIIFPEDTIESRLGARKLRLGQTQGRVETSWIGDAFDGSRATLRSDAEGIDLTVFHAVCKAHDLLTLCGIGQHLPNVILAVVEDLWRASEH
jgi:hypothetical protein